MELPDHFRMRNPAWVALSAASLAAVPFLGADYAYLAPVFYFTAWWYWSTSRDWY